MTVRVEQLVVEALKDYLLMKLPAKVAAVNALRAPVLKSALAGPYVIGASKKLKVATSGVDSGGTAVSLTTGTRTATQVAADINAVGFLAGIASADSDGRLVLTGQTAPTAAEQIIGVNPYTQTDGVMALFGWRNGGEVVVRAPLVAPTWGGIADGWPAALSLGDGFWIILGDRESIPVQPDVRRDEHLVGVEMVVVWRSTNISSNRDREAISACMRCVREVLLIEDGRQAGIASQGTLMKLEERKARIPGKPFSFRVATPNPLFDLGMMEWQARVYERP